MSEVAKYPVREDEPEERGELVAEVGRQLEDSIFYGIASRELRDREVAALLPSVIIGVCNRLARERSHMHTPSLLGWVFFRLCANVGKGEWMINRAHEAKGDGEVPESYRWAAPSRGHRGESEPGVWRHSYDGDTDGT